MERYFVRGCTQCDGCRWLCPVSAISFDGNGARIDPDLCIRCGVCRNNCPSEAIRVDEAPASASGASSGKA